MKLHTEFRTLVLTLALAVPFAPGCGGDDAAGSGSSSDNGGDGGEGTPTNADGKPTGEGPCEAASECAGDMCVAIIDGDNPPNYCTEECSPGSCPDGFYCDGSTFALLDVSFCRFGSGDDDGIAPGPDEPPKLPCQDDADCDGAFVCAVIEGEPECAVPCSDEPDCTAAAFGVEFDIATCGQDDDGRSVCIGDPACYPDVSSCIDTGIDIPGGGG